MSGSNFLSILANPTVMQPDAEGYAAGLKMAGQQWSNRQNQANQLSGQAQQAAIGADGTYSPELYRQGLQAAGPGAALAAQSGLAANQVQSDAQLAQARKLADFVNSASGAALKANDFSDQAMGALFNQAHAAGFSIPQVGQEMAGLPADAAGRKAWLQQNQFTSASTQLQLDQTYGARQPVNDGGATTFPVVPPASAGGAGPTVPNMPTPAERNATEHTWNPVTRQFDLTPRQAIAPMVDGQGNPVAGSAVPGLPTSGRPTPAGTPPPGPPNIAQPSPGTAEEMQGAAAHAVAARDAANGYQQRIQPIEGAITALAGADTGKGGEILNTMRAYTQDVAPKMLQSILPSTLMDTGARQAFEEANKYLTGMALGAPGGSRSNAGEAAATAATPSVHISNAAAQLVARAALAQQRLTQVGTLAFNQSGQPAGNYDTFMNTWNTNQDPRAFIADRMTPAERAATVKSLGGITTPAYQRYKQSYLAAQDAKVTDAPR